MLFVLSYLFFMIPTYVWRGVFIAENLQNTAPASSAFSLGTMYIVFIINYLILILIAYRRSKKVQKPVVAVLPVIAAVFDIFLGFIPLIPTVLNLMTLIMGAQKKQEQVVYVAQEEKTSENKIKDS